MKHVVLIFFILTLSSCFQQKDTDSARKVINDWRGKVIKYPTNTIYTVLGMDTVTFDTSHAQYKILTYIDSIGCISCKLKIGQWKELIYYLDTVMTGNVSFLFFFHPQNIKNIRAELYASDFKYPVCIDMNDSINRLNSFPQNFDYQTFLLDKQDKVLAIGNPIHNSEIKELYLNMMQKKDIYHKISTTALASTNLIDFGNINLSETAKYSFEIQNIGDKPLVIIGVDTSCGCLTTEYDKTAINKGDQNNITITYSPKQIGEFQETILIRGNIPKPIKILVKGCVI